MGNPVWALCVATSQELRPLQRLFGLRSRREAGLFPLYEGHHHGAGFVVLQTGVGPARASAAVSWLLKTKRVAGLVSLGVSGGLSDMLGRGHVVISSQWSCLSGEPATLRHVGATADQELMALALRAADASDTTVCTGELVTVDYVVRTTEGKRALAKQTGALAVDMESGAIAEVALAESVNCLAVRAILDTVDEAMDFSPTQFLSDNGSLSLWKSGCAIASRPRRLPALITLGQRTTHAMTVLAQWCGRFLDNVKSKLLVA